MPGEERARTSPTCDAAEAAAGERDADQDAAESVREGAERLDARIRRASVRG